MLQTTDACAVIGRLLDGDTFTVRQLCEEFGFKKARARRLAIAIANAMPGRVVFDGSPRTLALRRTGSAKTRVLALGIAHSLLQGARESLLDVELRGAVEEGMRDCADLPPVSVVRRFFVGRNSALANDEGVAEELDTVCEAFLRQVRVEFRYARFDGGPLSAVVEPWSVLFTETGWYLYGLVQESDDPRVLKEIRMFNLARASRLRLRSERYVYPAPDQYSPEVTFCHAFGLFLPRDRDPRERPGASVLRFARRWSAYLHRHKFHPSQRIIAETDVYLDVEFTVHLTLDFVQWVRGLGAAVAVVSPEELRSAVRDGLPGE